MVHRAPDGPLEEVTEVDNGDAGGEYSYQNGRPHQARRIVDNILRVVYNQVPITRVKGMMLSVIFYMQSTAITFRRKLGIQSSPRLHISTCP